MSKEKPLDRVPIKVLSHCERSSRIFFTLIKEKALSVFVDESGDTGYSGDTSKYYIVSFVFHNQQDDIS